MNQSVLRRSLLPAETRTGDQSAPGGIGIRHPHPKIPRPIGQGGAELVAAVNEFQRLDLAVAELCIGSCIGRVWILAIWSAQSFPRVSLLIALGHVKQRPRRHIIVDDSILE